MKIYQSVTAGANLRTLSKLFINVHDQQRPHDHRNGTKASVLPLVFQPPRLTGFAVVGVNVDAQIRPVDAVFDVRAAMFI